MKYGFVYIWYDIKHKRYYIGSHWGSEDDGYICSSSWMKRSYMRRPKDFKRRIISRVSERSILIKEEQKWLSFTKKQELGKRYYNLNNVVIKHWHTNEQRSISVRNKISHTKKGKHTSPGTEFKKGQHCSPGTEFKKGQVAHNKGRSLEERYGVERANEIRIKYSQAKLGKPSKSTTKFKKGNIPWNAKYSDNSTSKDLL